ncbi:MAG: patatin-like phospholipase family protein [Rhodobacter sp.]|nr:patatin-like phospholipase family protein [Rhodobacter sp.]
MEFRRRMMLMLAALAGLAACSGPEIVNRACPGLVSGSTAPVILSAMNFGTMDAPPPDPRGAVAERTTRMVAAQAARTPEAVMLQPAGLALRSLRAPARRVVRIDLLAMTTGGQYGAFSSGFLKGWSESGRRPDFAVVTGASAGGVIAPLVFAGKEFDDRLKLNAGIASGDVVRKRSFLELLGASSLFSTIPLQRAVGAAVDDRLIKAIAARWRAGNDLFLGATNLDQGRFELFDIGAFAAQEGVSAGIKRDCVVGAVMATSAIPGLFPPKRIGGDLYTDAGVRQSVFLRGVRDGIRESERVLGIDVRVTATLLVNSDLKVRREETATGLLDVAERTFALVSDEGLRESLVETVDLARRSGWRLRAAVAPDFDTLGCGDDDALFSACITEKLFEAGRAMGRTPQIAWLDGRELRELARRF